MCMYMLGGKLLHAGQVHVGPGGVLLQAGRVCVCTHAGPGMGYVALLHVGQMCVPAGPAWYGGAGYMCARQDGSHMGAGVRVHACRGGEVLH